MDDRKKRWSLFFTKVFIKLASKGVGDSFYLGNSSGKIKVKRLVKLIKSNDDLLNFYLSLCREFNHSDSDCIFSMPVILRNVMYSLYKSNVEPVASFVDLMIRRGYVTVADLQKLVTR